MEKNSVYILHTLSIRIQGSLVNSLCTADLSETIKQDPDLPDQDKVKKTLILTCSIAKQKSKPDHLRLHIYLFHPHVGQGVQAALSQKHPTERPMNVQSNMSTL